MQRFLFGSKPCGSALVALSDQVLEKHFVGTPIGKVTATPHAQGLIDRLFEAVMGLFDVSILMCDARIVPGWLHAVMGHEGLIPLGPVLALTLVQLADSSAQMISAVLLGHAPHLPQAAFQPFG